MEDLKDKWGGSLPVVGDWVFTPEKTVYFLATAKGIDFSVVYDICTPIPLTREVMEKIEESPLGRMLSITEYIDAYRKREKVFVSGFSREGEPTNEKHLPYLHQLQQLYRLLTGGKELTYTP